VSSKDDPSWPIIYALPNDSIQLRAFQPSIWTVFVRFSIGIKSVIERTKNEQRTYLKQRTGERRNRRERYPSKTSTRNRNPGHSMPTTSTSKTALQRHVVAKVGPPWLTMTLRRLPTAPRRPQMRLPRPVMALRRPQLVPWRPQIVPRRLQMTSMALMVHNQMEAPRYGIVFIDRLEVRPCLEVRRRTVQRNARSCRHVRCNCKHLQRNCLHHLLPFSF